jgi:CRISPR system Cascade subunit CasA
MRFSLLDDSLFRIRLSDESVEALTLPQILSVLSKEGIDLLSFEALQAHQQQAWYSFLVQLAAMAVARETGGEHPTDPAGWRNALVGLAADSEAAWHLVVDDPTKPAFLQSPVLEEAPDDAPMEEMLDDEGYKSDLASPDALDMLVTSKNHDVKQHRISRPRPEHWIYALVTLQTLEGYMGRGNYGIVRMHGAYANRPLVGLTPELSWGERFRRDLTVLLDEREELSEDYDLHGPALLWTVPWDGSKEEAIWLYDCDPYFIEICRRIRFTVNGSLTCWRATTKGQRVDAPGDLNGVTKDPWTPIQKEGGVKALNVGGSGFTYRLLQDILFEGTYDRPPALTFEAGDDGGAYVIAQTLARGQGKTEGLHRRVVFVPNRAKKRLLGTESERKRLGKRAQARVKRADDVQSQLLYPAIAILLGSGEGEDVDYEDVAPWIDRFDRAVDDRFFEALWTSVEEDMDEAEAKAHWESILWDEAEPIFEDAERSTPIADARRWRARSRARSLFYGQVRTVFESAPYTSTDTSEPEHATT